MVRIIILPKWWRFWNNTAWYERENNRRRSLLSFFQTMTEIAASYITAGLRSSHVHESHHQLVYRVCVSFLFFPVLSFIGQFVFFSMGAEWWRVRAPRFGALGRWSEIRSTRVFHPLDIFISHPKRDRSHFYVCLSLFTFHSGFSDRSTYSNLIQETWCHTISIWGERQHDRRCKFPA